MGKARILAGGTDGLYTVQVLFDRTRTDAEKAQLQAALDELAPVIADLDERLHLADLEVAEAAIEVDALIDQLAADGAVPPVDLSLLITLHNVERQARGRDPLTVSSALNAAAQGHATWLAQENRTGHTGQNNSRPRDRARDAGYLGDTGENVAAGVRPPEENAIRAWLNSSGHAGNLLDPDWEHIGVGYACRTDGQHRHFWVAMFGRGGTGGGGAPSAPSACADSDGQVPERIRAATELLARASRARDIIRVEHRRQIARKLEAETRLDQLQRLPDVVKPAWCADHSESLSGDVATAEIPDEGSNRLILRPGHDGRAVYDAERDGVLVQRGAQAAHQVFLNAALLPGVQRWMPQYRIGTINTVDTDTDLCTVTLAVMDSSAYGLIINPPSLQLSGVPIEYMDCDSKVFLPGDRVLVQFRERDWSQPVVVGFEANPRPCEFIIVNYTNNQSVTRLQLQGATTQEIPRGGSTTPVLAVPLEPRAAFWKWRDGNTDNPRSDANVQQGFTVRVESVLFTAHFRSGISRTGDCYPPDEPGWQPWQIRSRISVGRVGLIPNPGYTQTAEWVYPPPNNPTFPGGDTIAYYSEILCSNMPEYEAFNAMNQAQRAAAYPPPVMYMRHIESGIQMAYTYSRLGLDGLPLPDTESGYYYATGEGYYAPPDPV